MSRAVHLGGLARRTSASSGAWSHSSRARTTLSPVATRWSRCDWLSRSVRSPHSRPASGGFASFAVGPILRGEHSVAYWAASVVLLGLTFMATTNAVSLGAGSVNYLLTLPLAAGTGVALVASGSRTARLGVAAAIGLIGATNIAGLVSGHADTPRGAIGRYEHAIARRVEAQGATHGYAGYWDAHNLTWQSGLRLLTAPVSTCGSALCGHTFTTIASWYRPQHGRSFLITDSSNAFVSATVGGSARLDDVPLRTVDALSVRLRPGAVDSSAAALSSVDA